MSFYQSGFYQPGFYNPGFYNRQAGDSLPTLSAPYESDNIIRLVDCYPIADKGCSIIHNGRRTPNFDQGFSVGAISIIWMNWDDMLNSNETISSSTWVLPAQLTALAQATNQTVVDSMDTQYQYSNGLRFGTGTTPGIYQVINTISTTRNSGAGRTISRAVNIDVRAYV